MLDVWVLNLDGWEIWLYPDESGRGIHALNHCSVRFATLPCAISPFANNVLEKRQKLTPTCLQSENTAQTWVRADEQEGPDDGRSAARTWSGILSSLGASALTTSAFAGFFHPRPPFKNLHPTQPVSYTTSPHSAVPVPHHVLSLIVSHSTALGTASLLLLPVTKKRTSYRQSAKLACCLQTGRIPAGPVCVLL